MAFGALNRIAPLDICQDLSIYHIHVKEPCCFGMRLKTSHHIVNPAIKKYSIEDEKQPLNYQLSVQVSI